MSQPKRIAVHYAGPGRGDHNVIGVSRGVDDFHGEYVSAEAYDALKSETEALRGDDAATAKPVPVRYAIADQVYDYIAEFPDDRARPFLLQLTQRILADAREIGELETRLRRVRAAMAWKPTPDE